MTAGATARDVPLTYGARKRRIRLETSRFSTCKKIIDKDVTWSVSDFNGWCMGYSVTVIGNWSGMAVISYTMKNKCDLVKLRPIFLDAKNRFF